MSAGPSTSLGDKALEDLTQEQKLANSTADQFQKLYYDAMDKRRHLIGKMYLENGVLIWNGHTYSNSGDIQKFLSTLAPSNHQVISLDAIPVPAIAVGAQKTILVHVAGNVQLRTDYTRAFKQFHQCFLITQQQDKWKIVSDTFRTQNPAGALTI